MKNILGSAAVFTALSINCFGQCGVERWAVKTGTDADSRLVNLSTAASTTIGNLIALPAPSSKPENNRVQPTETTLFVLNATLTQ